MRKTVDGKKYQVFLLKKSALFPQQSGTLELDPAEADGTARIVHSVRQRDPFADMMDRDPALKNAFGSLLMSDPLFNNGYFNQLQYQDVPAHIKSAPVKIAVTALPEAGKPEDFTGAVGNFTVSGKISKTDLTTDEALNYTLTITGSGNLKLIEVPKLKLPNGLDSYDPVVIDTITGRSTTISGSKIATYAITPHTPGDYEIPSIPFSAYNPQTGKYVTLSTAAFKIHVKPGKHYNPAGSNNNIVAIKDIHNIGTQPLPLQSAGGRPLLFTACLLVFICFPPFCIHGPCRLEA